MVNDPEQEGRDRIRRTQPKQLTPLHRTLMTLDARPPGPDEVAAIKAITRGSATPGQQRVAMAYIIELCGAGRVAFGGEKGIFVNGARAVSVAIGQIAGAVYLRFPAVEEPDGE